MTFQKWLKSIAQHQDDAKKLLSDFSSYNLSFPESKVTLEDLLAEIDGLNQNDIVKAELKILALKLWNAFEHSAIKHDESGGWTIRATLLSAMGIVLIVFIMAALLMPGFRCSLGKIETVRGLITFLFALGTIGIAVIIIVSIFTSQLSKEESKERFYRAKEILTILIGILGTIVGYYFGAPVDTSGVDEIPVLSAPFLFPDPVANDQPFTFVSQVKGGVPPYSYSLEIKAADDTLVKELQGDTENGLITEPLELDLASGSYLIRLTLEDTQNQRAIQTKKFKAIDE